MGWFSKNKDKKKKEEEDKQKSKVPLPEDLRKEEENKPDNEESKQQSVVEKSKEDKAIKQQPQQQHEKLSQQKQQNLIAEEDVWIYESLLQFLVSPMFQSPINQFIDEKCIYFENTQSNSSIYKEVFKEFKTKMDELVIELAQDIGVEPDKIMEIAELGLNFKSQQKYFVYFLIYYHFDEFVRILAKQNLSLEQKAFQHLVEKNKKNPNYNGDDQEISQAIQNSLSSTQIKSDKEYQKAILASQKEFDQRKQIQDREDQMLQQAIRLSSIEEGKSNSKIQQEVKENKEGHSDSKKIIKPVQKSNDEGDDLIRIDESDEEDEDNLYYDLKSQKIANSNSSNKNEDFDKMLTESRLNLRKNLEMMDQKDNTQAPQETLQMRIDRLKKERQIILQNKKREREDELSQFNDQMSQMDFSD